MKPQQRTLAELTESELVFGINHYEYRIAGRQVFGRMMTERDKALVREWQGKVDRARAELKRRQPHQDKLI